MLMREKLEELTFKELWLPGRVVSLWDMIKSFNPLDISQTYKLIDLTILFLELPNTKIDNERIKYVQYKLSQIQDRLKNFSLGEIRRRYLIIEECLDNVPNDGLISLFKTLGDIIEHELLSNECFVIPRDSGSLRESLKLSNKANKLSEELSFHFDAAIKCYVYDRFTASIFHVMRAAGELLPAVAPKLLETSDTPISIDLRDNWSKVIDHLQSRVNRLKTKARSDMNERPKFDLLSGLLDRMSSIQTAWRDKTMHTLNDVQPKQAEVVLIATNDLVEYVTENMQAINELKISPQSNEDNNVTK